MLYKSLTQTERIAWDLANAKPVVRHIEGSFICHVCYKWVIGLETHAEDCSYRRAVEWKAEKVARWEAER